MTIEKPESDRRTKLMFEIRYGRVACERESRFFTRCDTAMRFCELGGASAVIVGVLGAHQAIAIGFGVLLALIPVASVVYDPRGKAFTAERLRERFASLAAEAPLLDDGELERRIRRLQSDAGPDPLKAIRYIAYNDAIEESNLDPAAAYRLTRWQRFLEAMS